LIEAVFGEGIKEDLEEGVEAGEELHEGEGGEFEAVGVIREERFALE